MTTPTDIPGLVERLSKLSFTPGPWDYKPNAILSDDGVVAWIGARIARESNAQLIAEAPTLLTALQSLLEENQRLREAAGNSSITNQDHPHDH